MANRILFQTPESALVAINIMQIGHVLLDPFPVTGKDDDDDDDDDDDHNNVDCDDYDNVTSRHIYIFKV